MDWAPAWWNTAVKKTKEIIPCAINNDFLIISLLRCTAKGFREYKGLIHYKHLDFQVGEVADLLRNRNSEGLESLEGKRLITTGKTELLHKYKCYTFNCQAISS
jgi:hypothetical protein